MDKYDTVLHRVFSMFHAYGQNAFLWCRTRKNINLAFIVACAAILQIEGWTLWMVANKAYFSGHFTTN
jgi:hypothetical protein